MDIDFGLLGREGDSSGLSGVNGRELASGPGDGLGDSRMPRSKGFRVDRRRAFGFSSKSCDPCDGLRVGCNSPGWLRGELAASSDRDSMSLRLWTPYMLSLGSPGSGGETDSVSEACGLRDKKNVAGAAVRGSRGGEGGSKGGFRGKVGRSGTGRMIQSMG